MAKMQVAPPLSRSPIPAPLLALALALVACTKEPPLAEASRVAREFVEAFAKGDHEAAGRLATGDVLNGVEVAAEARAHERAEHPAEVALLDQAMRAHPPDVALRAPRRQDDETAVVRAVVTTEGPGGPARVQYELWLVWREARWLVYRWERR